MKKTYATLMGIVLMAALSACATTKQEAPAAPEVSVAAAKSADQPGGIIGQKVVTRVIVDSIDYKERTAVLRELGVTMMMFIVLRSTRPSRVAGSWPSLKMNPLLDQTTVENQARTSICISLELTSGQNGRASSRVRV